MGPAAISSEKRGILGNEVTRGNKSPMLCSPAWLGLAPLQQAAAAQLMVWGAGSGAGSTAGHPCLGTAVPGAGSAGTAHLVPSPSLLAHRARVGALHCPQGLGEPIPTQDLQSRVEGKHRLLPSSRAEHPCLSWKLGSNCSPCQTPPTALQRDTGVRAGHSRSCPAGIRGAWAILDSPTEAARTSGHPGQTFSQNTRSHLSGAAPKLLP